MVQPDEYNRSFDFTSFQELFPTQPLPAAQVDVNLDNVAISVNQIIARLALLQRDDGALLNALVTLESLSTEVLSALGTALDPKGAWVTATTYAVMDLAEESGNTYLCGEAHTSGVFATDLAADKWILFSLGSTGSQPVDAMLTAIAGLTSAADEMMYFTGPDAVATTGLSAFARTVVDDANAAAMRATLGLTIGTDVQAQEATLQALTGALSAANKIPYATALDVLGELDFKDEDNMVSDSDTALSSQQAIKAYVDATAAAQAAQSAIEAETDENTYIPPDLIKYSPGVAKAWLMYDQLSSTATVNASYNITGIADDGTGIATVTIATDFSSANYCAVGMAQRNIAGDGFGVFPTGNAAATPAAGTIALRTAIYSTGALIDSPWVSVAFFGDQ